MEATQKHPVKVYDLAEDFNLEPGDLILISSPDASFHYRPDAAMVVVMEVRTHNQFGDPYKPKRILTRRVDRDSYGRKGTWSLLNGAAVYNHQARGSDTDPFAPPKKASKSRMFKKVSIKDARIALAVQGYEANIATPVTNSIGHDLPPFELFEERDLVWFVHPTEIRLEFNPSAESISKVFGASNGGCNVPGCVAGLVCTRCTGLDAVYPTLRVTDKEHDLLHKVGTPCPQCIGLVKTMLDLDTIRQWFKNPPNLQFRQNCYMFREKAVAGVIKAALNLIVPTSKPELWGLPPEPEPAAVVQPPPPGYENSQPVPGYEQDYDDNDSDDENYKQRLHQWKLQSLLRDSHSATPEPIGALHADGDVKCPICYGHFKVGDLLTAATCPRRHVFHTACVVPLWWVENRTCPVDFVVLDEEEVREAQED
ncbi:uncharacterized protein K452DRAFT_306796 [Aplosporella prunicola CBS 121167]|uniref:RING-type domain-containing protein n=1 Tax=Aplosporella prunicola CBS 121167 TaxID=1176127 RepID=A0A6A6BMY7_9PEZI|nr:uncharacterized protein K452DRAFT_306796 [Aplosporella prunicola CBS 121167]KAF2144187.1 hypothetical protein K452DRAFT_306796 [Aplosporella prunicola CBS 121167]